MSILILACQIIFSGILRGSVLVHFYCKCALMTVFFLLIDEAFLNNNANDRH